MNRSACSIPGLMVIALLGLPIAVFAQSTITFRVNMSGQMEDSTFIPARNIVAIAGNQLPFSQTHTVAMQNKTSADSIYTASVHFPAFLDGRELTYHYLIKRDDGRKEEQFSRTIRLNGEVKTLPVEGFNEVLQ